MSDPRDLTRRVLLAALHPIAPVFSSLLADSYQRLDWPWLLNRATEHKVAALLAWRVEEAGIADRLPPLVQGRLQAIGRTARRRTAQAARTLTQVAGAFDAAGIPFLLIKGTILSELVYRRPTIRPFHDVDVVVAWDMLTAAEEVLASLGYSLIPPTAKRMEWVGVKVDGVPGEAVPHSIARAFYAKQHCHFQLAPPTADRLPVEVHWQLAPPGILRVSEAQLWANTASTSVGGMSVRCLNGEAMIVHAASHAINDGRTEVRLLHLADVAWLLERAPTSWQPDRVWQLARQWDAAGDLSCVLMLIHDLFGYRHPQLAPPSGGREAIRHATLRSIAGPMALVDRNGAGRGPAQMLGALLGESLWELSEGKLPVRARRIATNAIRAKFDGLLKRTQTAEPAPTAPGAPVLPPDLQSLVADTGRDPARVVDLRVDQFADQGSFLIQFEGGAEMKARLEADEREAQKVADLSTSFSRGPFPELFGRRGRALLFEWIDGEPFSYQRRELASFRACGALLAHVHGLDPPSELPMRSHASGHMRDRLHQAMEELVARGQLTRAAAQQTGRLALDRPPSSAEVGVTYAGFSAERIVVDWTGDVYLSNVGRLEVDSLDYDLTRILQRWNMTLEEREAFLNEYAKTRSLESFHTYRVFWTMLARLESELNRQRRIDEIAGTRQARA